MAKPTPFILILLFTGVFALIMLSFSFLGDHTIATPNQSEVETPELNAYTEETADQQQWVYKILWAVMIVLILFAVALAIKMFLGRKSNW